MSELWKWLGPLWSGKMGSMRFFAEEGGGGGTATATAKAADTSERAATAEGVADDADNTSEAADDEPWYRKIEGLDEDDQKILTKYKTPEDAIRSIKHREKLLGDAVKLPAEDAEDETRQKAHQKILMRMGAPKKANDYADLAERAMAEIPDSVKGALDEDDIPECCRQAVDLNLLPWQFERLMAMKLGAVEATLRGHQDARDASERALKKIAGARYEQFIGNSNRAAQMFDDDMFRTENAALPNQQRTEQGGIVTEMVRDLQGTKYGPVITRILNYNFDRLFSEGDGSIRGMGPGKVDDDYTRHYKDAQTNWPARGTEYWAKYAREQTGGGR